jgi:hypothetical protein
MTTAAKASCIICKKETSNLGIAAHIRISHLGDNSLQLKGNAATLGKPAWNRGKTKLNDSRVADAAVKIAASMIGIGHTPSQETRRKTSLTMKGRTGGYRQGSGIGKSGWYESIWCDSTWELAYIIWCKSLGKNITRNSETFEYEFDGKRRRYLPDFIVDGQIVEIKGRRKTDALIDAKLAATFGRVKILLAEDMLPILESVKHLQPLEKLYGR